MAAAMPPFAHDAPYPARAGLEALRPKTTVYKADRCPNIKTGKIGSPDHLLMRNSAASAPPLRQFHIMSPPTVLVALSIRNRTSVLLPQYARLHPRTSLHPCSPYYSSHHSSRTRQAARYRGAGHRLREPRQVRESIRCGTRRVTLPILQQPH